MVISLVGVSAPTGEREWRNWQTRTVQVRVPERAWGFKSPLAHHSPELLSSGLLTYYGVGCATALSRDLESSVTTQGMVPADVTIFTTLESG